MSDSIKGFMDSQLGQCDFCHRIGKNMFTVREGPTTGRFCSGDCFQRARAQMESGYKSVPKGDKNAQ